jgi:predicted nucleotidyltransferase
MIDLFGSTVRGKATEQSDIDLLVWFARIKSLLALVRLQRELSAALGRKVGLLTKAALSPYLRERSLRELQVIYTG